MATEEDLVVGRFYWVIPEPRRDSLEVWEDGLQPARYAGMNVDRELLWNFICCNGCTNRPVRWIGDLIDEPSMVD
jgi:hypothetical protein